MKRLTRTPRRDWQAKVEALGFVYHTTDRPYWDESVCYEFTRGQIDVLEAATNELQRLCLAAVQRVIDEKLYRRLAIPDAFGPVIERSWEREDLSVYGRFDLWWDGRETPRLYEYNADTPTSLLEAAVVQWHWLEECHPDADQFNRIHEQLIERWREGGVHGRLHFACLRDSAEDFANTVYLEDTAMQAGCRTKRLFVDEIGWNGSYFTDPDEERIEVLFKLYPWEWLVREEFGVHLLSETMQLVEPAWKMVLSNKGILPVLWEMFPGHPNLIPAFTDPHRLGSAYVRKPLFSREGSSIGVHLGGREVVTPGDYGSEGCIYQGLLPPPAFDGRYPVIGSWVVRDEAAGIGIREDSSPVTTNTSRFVPHYFVG